MTQRINGERAKEIYKLLKIEEPLLDPAYVEVVKKDRSVEISVAGDGERATIEIADNMSHVTLTHIDLVTSKIKKTLVMEDEMSVLNGDYDAVRGRVGVLRAPQRDNRNPFPFYELAMNVSRALGDLAPEAPAQTDQLILNTKALMIFNELAVPPTQDNEYQVNVTEKLGVVFAHAFGDGYSASVALDKQTGDIKMNYTDGVQKIEATTYVSGNDVKTFCQAFDNVTGATTPMTLMGIGDEDGAAANNVRAVVKAILSNNGKYTQ